MGRSSSDALPVTRRLLGVGVDIASVSRIARTRSRGDVLQKVCSDEELALFPLNELDAARLWAAKEAVVKTLGTGFWQQGVDWTDIRLSSAWDVSLDGAALDHAGRSTFELEFELDGDLLVATCRRWSTEAE